MDRDGDGLAERRFDAASLHAVVAIDPMPWDLSDISARAAQSGPVVVVDMQMVDLRAVLECLAPGAAVLLQWPGADDAHEIASLLATLAAGSGRARSTGRRLEAVIAIIADAGLRVIDCGQWRGAYRFLDADAVLDFLALAWWLPGDLPPADVRMVLPAWEIHRRPIVATLSRFWVLARRPE